MKEELIVSGRMNHMVDPSLNIWHWPIPLYLFLGGMAAGILCIAAVYFIRGRENDYRTAVRITPFLAPVLLIMGLVALFIDLRHKLFFWQLYTNIKLQSPMSWGAWTLLVITPVSFIWCALHMRDIFPRWDWKYKWLKVLEEFFNKYKKALAWVMLIYGLILGVYTGILLSAFNARPLWNTSILGPLFLVSGLSAGAACTLLLSKDEGRKDSVCKNRPCFYRDRVIPYCPHVHGIPGQHPGPGRCSKDVPWRGLYHFVLGICCFAWNADTCIA